MATKEIENASIYLILVTGVIGPRRWLYTSHDKDKRDSQPLSFLSKVMPDINVETFYTIESVGNVDGHSTVSYPDLGQRGRDLLQYIDELRDNIHGRSPILIFAGHDVGGITVKQALVTANYEAQYEWVVKSTIAAVFFETPYHTSSHYAWEKSILQMLALSEADLDFASYFENLPEFCNRLEEEFRGFLKYCYSANFYARNSPLYSAMEDHQLLSIGYDKTRILDCDTREIWSIGDKDPAATHICQLLSDLRSNYRKDYVEGDEDILRLLTELDHDWHLLRSSNNWPLWHNSTGQIWNIQWYDAWAKKTESGALHVVGSSGSGVTAFASKILHQLRGDGNIVLAYSMLSITVWPQHGSEIPIIRLFHSLCQQLLQRFGGSPIRLPLCSWIVKERLFTKEALMGLLCSLLSLHTGSSVFCVIHGTQVLSPTLLEQLFKDLEAIMKSSKATLKLIITSNLKESSPNSPGFCTRVNILEEQQKHGVLRQLATVGIESLAESRPVWRQPELKERAINKLCNESQTIFELSQKLAWIRSVKSPQTISSVESTITEIPGSLEGTIASIFRTSDKVDSAASSALTWILFSPRPLSISEISVCVAMGAVSKPLGDLRDLISKISWNTSSDLLHSLGHVIHISGDRVRIGHPHLASLLKKQSFLSIPNDPHFLLLSACIRYLTIMNKHWKAPTANHSTTQVPGELLLAEYAAVYWPYHGFLAQKRNEATALILDFLQNPDHFNIWLNILNTYRRHLAAGSGELEQPKTPVEVACHFGLIDVVNKFLEEQPLTESSIQGLMSGLNFVIEKGYTNIAHRIIAKGIISEGALIRAARFGRTKILKALFKPLSENESIDDSEASILLEATYGGHLETVTLLLDRGADVNTKNSNGLTPLHLASRIGQLEIVAKLIELGSSLSSQDEDGYTALMYASEGGFDGIVQSITSAIEAKKRHSGIESIQVVLDLYTSNGDTALHLAVYSSHKTTAKLLLDLGASPTKKNNIGHTPLHFASEHGFLEIAKMILERFPDHTYENPIVNGKPVNPVVAESPLRLAVRNRQLPIVKELLLAQKQNMKTSSFEAVSYACECGHLDLPLDILQWYRSLELDDGLLCSDDGTTALHLAVSFGRLKLVEKIIEHDLVPINSLDRKGWTPLHKAAKRGDVGIIDTLLDRNAISTATTEDGHTALHLAAENGHKEACAILVAKNPALTTMASKDESLPVVLAAKADQSHVVEELLNRDKATPKGGLLHIAVQIDSEELLETLLKTGINLDWIDKQGNTAVHLAVCGRQISILQRLYEAGANMSTKGQGGQTPLFRAVEDENLEMVKALMELDANLAPDEQNDEGLTPLLMACTRFFTDEENTIEIVRELLERYSDLDINFQHPDSGKTPLHYSTDGVKDGLTMLLLDKRADPNIRNNRGSTPIFLAAELGKIQSIYALLNKGASASIRNNADTTPLHRAAGDQHAECISALLSHGAAADINVKDRWGKTPLALAVGHGNEACIKALLEHNPDLTIMDDDGLTPLANAIDEGYNDIADMLANLMKPEDIHHTIRGAMLSGNINVASKLLANPKANGPNIVDKAYGSFFGLAIARRVTAIAQTLIEWPAVEINTKDSVGRTPLLVATCLNDLTMIQALTKANADPNISDDDGDWPLICAIKQGRAEIVELLVNFDKTDLTQTDGRGHDALYWACRQSNRQIFDSVHNAVKNLPTYKPMCQLALHAAVASKSNDALDSLLTVKALDVNVVDSDGWTPLYTAECYEHFDIKERLIELGANTESNTTPKVPTAWHGKDKCAGLSVSQIDLPTVRVEATTHKPTDMDGVARYVTAKGDHPLPGHKDWYFEVKIQQAFQDGEQLLGVGIAEDDAIRFRMLGVENPHSYAYHADDGECFPQQASNEVEGGETYGQGDVIGCGFVHESKSVYFKRNGESLGQAFSDIRGKFYAAVFMSSREVGVCMSVNFNKGTKKKK